MPTRRGHVSLGNSHAAPGTHGSTRFQFNPHEHQCNVGNWKIQRAIRSASSPLFESDDLSNTFPIPPRTLPTDQDMVTDYDLSGARKHGYTKQLRLPQPLSPRRTLSLRVHALRPTHKTGNATRSIAASYRRHPFMKLIA
jgi:hypothetical protein